MTTDQQVRLLMTLIKKGLPLVMAAAKAGMSERTARKYRGSGKLASELRMAHTWRTRPDPFEEVWPEVEELLEQDAGLQAKTVFDEFGRRCAPRPAPGGSSGAAGVRPPGRSAHPALLLRKDLQPLGELRSAWFREPVNRAPGRGSDRRLNSPLPDIPR